MADCNSQIGNTLHEGLGSVSYPFPDTMVTQRPLLPLNLSASLFTLECMDSGVRVLTPSDALTHDCAALHFWSLGGPSCSCLNLSLVTRGLHRLIPGSEPILVLVSKEDTVALNIRDHYATYYKQH